MLILVLCTEGWLISVQERQQSFGMTRQARSAKPSPPIHVNNAYYTHYFLYYTYYFECLSTIQQPVTSTYALQADIHRSYEMYVAITSRRKLSFRSHGSNHAIFFCIIRITSLLYHIILIISWVQNSFWVRIDCWKPSNWHIHHRGSVSIQTKGSLDSFIDLQRAVSNDDSRCLNRPIGIVLADVRQPTSTQFRFEPITQSIDTCGKDCTLFLPDVIGDSEIGTNLRNNWYN